MSDTDLLADALRLCLIGIKDLAETILTEGEDWQVDEPMAIAVLAAHAALAKVNRDIGPAEIEAALAEHYRRIREGHSQ